MSREQGGVVTSRLTKHNTSNQYNNRRKINGYKSYDWRPRGCDGESKKPASRIPCDAAEILSRRSSPCCGTHLDIHPAGVPSFPSGLPLGRRRRSSGYNTHSTKFFGGNTSLCDYRQCHASEKFSSRVSSPHSTHGGHCFGASSQSFTQKPSNPASNNRICLRHNCQAPGMQPAGIITRNYEYPYPPEMHSIVRLDSYIHHQGHYNRLGQLVKESFKPRLGDAIIVKMPRVHPKKDTGYVEFFTTKHEGCHFCPGDLLVRVGKFVENNTWRYNKRFKLYQQTDEYQWLFIGMVDNFVNLLPVTNHGINSSHIDQHCRSFFPRRGDIIVHLQPPDKASQLQWFNPKTNIGKGDILLRMYVGEPAASGALREVLVDATIEIFMYSGKGFGWIFMGRDDCLYKDGFDLLDT